MKIDESMKLDSQLCFPLYAASRKIVSLYTPHLKPLGITYTQYIMFLVLWEGDGITVGELCKKLRLVVGAFNLADLHVPLVKAQALRLGREAHRG